jgi:hypothetical protein
MISETIPNIVESILNQPYLTVHIAGLIIAVGAVVVTDGLTMVAKLRPRAMKLVMLFSPFLSMLVWAGFLLLAVSGILLVDQTRGYMASSVFRAKMLFVGLVFVNGIVLNERIVPRMEGFVDRGVYDPPQRFKLLAMVSAIVSMIGWWGTTYVAYFRL